MAKGLGASRGGSKGGSKGISGKGVGGKNLSSTGNSRTKISAKAPSQRITATPKTVTRKAVKVQNPSKTKHQVSTKINRVPTKITAKRRKTKIKRLSHSMAKQTVRSKGSRYTHKVSKNPRNSSNINPKITQSSNITTNRARFRDQKNANLIKQVKTNPNTVTKLTNQQVGDLGEKIVRDQLAQRYNRVKYGQYNKSGNGIDILSATSRDPRTSKYATFEVKTSSKGMPNINKIKKLGQGRNRYLKTRLPPLTTSKFASGRSVKLGKEMLQSLNTQPRRITNYVATVNLKDPNNPIVRYYKVPQRGRLNRTSIGSTPPMPI
jgi:hypothetical protein